MKKVCVGMPGSRSFNVGILLCIYSAAGNTFAAVGALDDLNDIILPDPVSVWPPAPGWWALLILAIGFLVFGGLRWRTRVRKNAYRRAALTELEAATSAIEMAELLRRTALTAYPRREVIALRGDAWFQWLETTANLTMSQAARMGATAIYTGSEAEPTALKQFTRDWIINHTTPEPPASHRPRAKNEPC